MRVVRLYYGFQIFFSLLLWLPVFYEYQKRIGLGDHEIFAIQSLYYIVFCLLEIPTGLLADRWGYLRCLRAGAVVLLLSNFLPVFAPDYFGMLVHFLLIALARSLVSGASSAYLFEYLVEYLAGRRVDRDGGARGTEYKRVEGNARAYGLVGKVLLWAAVGGLMEWRLSLPYELTALTSAVAVYFAWKLPELPGPRTFGRKPGWDGLGAVLRFLRQSPALALVMIQGVAVFVLARILQVNLFQPLLAEKGFSLASYGALMSMMTLFEALGSFGAGLRVFRGNHFGWVSTLTLGVAASLVSLGLPSADGWILVGGGLAGFSLCIGMVFPIQRQLMNEKIPDSRYRATVLSFESIVDRAVCAWVVSGLGGFVAGSRVGEFLILAACTSAGLIVVLALAFRLIGAPRIASNQFERL